jgi:AcrR family transcriptional regulator
MSSTTDRAVPSRPVASSTIVRPMRKDAARNRELLLASARVVFAQRGVDASLDDIAHHAGLGVGTAYRHFSNKHELVAALMDHLVDTFVDQAENALAISDPWQALVTFLEQALDVQARDRGLREVLHGWHDSARFGDVHDRITALLTVLIERAKDAGQVRSDLEGSDIGMIVSMVCTVADFSGGDSPDLWRRYLALCLDGIRPAPTTLPGPALSAAEFRTAMINFKQIG